MTRPAFRILLALSAASLGACYKYVPLATPQPEVGTEVRSFLTPEGSSSLATTVGRNVTVLDGRLLEEQSNVWRLAVSQTMTAEDRRVSWTGEPVSVPRSAVARMELRVIDRPRTIRTVIVAALGGIAVGLLVRGISTGTSGGGDPVAPPP
ncbi:MAG: hypothetical protein IT361_15020 [Gemmatimonadaceae bacterium]|nr:hypothetical protein [Gemmatimonadaceae bacterium]